MLDKNSVRRNTKSAALITKAIPTSDQINSDLPDGTINPYAPFPDDKGNFYFIDWGKWLYCSTNCYAFAIGAHVAGDYHRFDYLPGKLGGAKHLCLENLADNVKLDLKALGRDVKEVIYEDLPKKLPIPEPGSYWIKAYCDEEGNLDTLHFSRKDVNTGKWIHKIGWEAAPKVVVRNKFISKLAMVRTMMPGALLISNEFFNAAVAMIDPSITEGYTVKSSVYETDDSAGYTSLTEDSQLKKLRVLFVARITE